MNTYSTEIAATLVGRMDGDDWPHYRWTVTLTRHGLAEKMVVPFSMGMAHEQTKCGKPKPSGRYATMPCQHVRCYNAGWQPAPPTLYDVLCSLKADATHGALFEEWCRDYGYDTDSIKARETYFACQESEARARRFFGTDWPTILDDEDYT